MTSMIGGGTGRRLGGLAAALALALTALGEAVSGEWEDLRESYDKALKAHARRITEIEARERGVPDAEKRADKLTRDRIAGIKASAKGSAKARSLADTAERATADATALADLDRAQAQQIDVVTSEWGAQGSERRKLRDAMASAQKNLERANASLGAAVRGAEATTHHLSQSGGVEALGRIEEGLKEAGDRLSMRWQNEQAARERERQQRERAAAERERGRW